ncbi:MAG: hypothetical protein JNL81_15075 [Hyphomonadaceae bacterium]|nr:hypothetical protein [Hyphomonadaceae bacterium]
MSDFIQTAANVAVLASLIFVALQVRMGVEMLRDAAVRNHLEKTQSISRLLAENAQLADVWSRGSKGGLASLGDGERVQFVNFCTFMFRTMEELHMQHTRGKMDNALYISNITIFRDVHQLRGAAEAWQVRRHLFTPEFQSFYESYVTSGEAKPLYDLPPSANA